MAKEYFLFFVICIILASNLSAGFLHPDLFASRCETPNKTPGFCYSLSRCHALRQLLQAEPTSEEVKKFYRNSLCGDIDEEDPDVCCGNDSYFIKSRIEAEKKLQEQNLHSNPSKCGEVNDDYSYSGIRVQWNALLQYQKASGELVFACGGSIITKKYILTAAHCVSGNILTSIGKLVSVRLGEYNISSEAPHCSEDKCINRVLSIPVEAVVVHPEYVEKIENRRHDIALVRLSEDIHFSETVQPVCLPLSDTKNATYFVGSGWGITPQGKKTASKKEMNIITTPQISKEKCNELLKVHKTTVTDDHLCMENPAWNENDLCYVESGGSLNSFSFFDNRAHAEGISSIRWNCENKKAPHVFTKVGNYIPWITENVKP